MHGGHQSLARTRVGGGHGLLLPGTPGWRTDPGRRCPWRGGGDGVVHTRLPCRSEGHTTPADPRRPTWGPTDRSQMSRTPGHPKTQCPQPSRPGDGQHTQPRGPSTPQEPGANAAGHLGRLGARPRRDPAASEGPQATHRLSCRTTARIPLPPGRADGPASSPTGHRGQCHPETHHMDVLPLHHPEKRGPWQESRARASTPTWPPPTGLTPPTSWTEMPSTSTSSLDEFSESSEDRKSTSKTSLPETKGGCWPGRPREGPRPQQEAVRAQALEGTGAHGPRKQDAERRGRGAALSHGNQYHLQHGRVPPCAVDSRGLCWALGGGRRGESLAPPSSTTGQDSGLCTCARHNPPPASDPCAPTPLPQTHADRPPFRPAPSLPRTRARPASPPPTHAGARPSLRPRGTPSDQHPVTATPRLRSGQTRQADPETGQAEASRAARRRQSPAPHPAWSSRASPLGLLARGGISRLSVARAAAGQGVWSPGGARPHGQLCGAGSGQPRGPRATPPDPRHPPHLGAACCLCRWRQTGWRRARPPPGPRSPSLSGTCDRRAWGSCPLPQTQAGPRGWSPGSG